MIAVNFGVLVVNLAIGLLLALKISLTCLPLGIVIFLPNWTPQPQNDHKEVFEFRDREVNASLLAKITEAVFRQNFIPIEPPKGWTVEEVPFIPEDDSQRVAVPSGQQQNQLPR